MQNEDEEDQMVSTAKRGAGDGGIIYDRKWPLRIEEISKGKIRLDKYRCAERNLLGRSN